MGCAHRLSRHSKVMPAQRLSVTRTRERSGTQRRTSKSRWRAPSVNFLGRWPRSWGSRADGASTVKQDTAQTRLAQGRGTRSSRLHHRNPLALTPGR
jgi:hypothetical protein